ncbi:MAG TPA: hypothetical protein VME92_13260 [Acetobacteraceae bacterium]|nr:hypothetical protein [Acetobacteraceae bacterium]
MRGRLSFLLRWTCLALALAGAGASLSACVYAPPGPPPRYGAHWVPGHHDYYGRWIPGHWV